jgi:hypothetical protein
MINAITRSWLAGAVLAVAALAAPSVSLAAAHSDAVQADVCVTIDQAHDTFPPEDRVAALLLVARQLELAGEHVVSEECSTPYTVGHVRLGGTIIVTLSGQGDFREGTALGLDDLPALYSQMVRSIVTGQPMTAMSVVDRSNVTIAQSSARRVHSDSLWYARLGYGGVFGDDAYGTPAFGFGYRAELDSFAIDVSFLNFQVGTSSGASTDATAGSLLKLSGLYFLNPKANLTGYFGGGLSYGHSTFGDWNYSSAGNYHTAWDGSGLQGELTVGYEIARATSLRLFVQADAVLPFYKVTAESFSRSASVTTTDRRYAPSLVVSIGLGR